MADLYSGGTFLHSIRCMDIARDNPHTQYLYSVGRPHWDFSDLFTTDVQKVKICIAIMDI